MLRPGSSGAIALCVLTSLCTASATLHAAEPEKEAVHLDYVAEGRCPARARVLSDIEAHAYGWDLAEPNAHARRFVLRIARRDGQYVGRLDIHSLTGEVSAGNEIRGPECDDVALGLTVAVALALDPRASGSPSPPIPPAPEPEPRAQLLPEAPPDAQAPRPAPTSSTRTARPTPNAGAESGISGPYVGVGARIEGSRGVAGVLGGASVFGELAWQGPLRWLAPKARLGARRTLPARIDVTGGHVDMALSAAFAELCPVALALGSRVEAGACLQGSVGALSAAAEGVTAARDEQRIWLDYGGLGTLRWWLDRHVSLEAGLGLSVPITRHRIRLEADGVVSRADPLVLGAGAGIIHRF
jgi:hypothetical protein